MHSRLRLLTCTIQRPSGGTYKAKFQQEWWLPLAWSLSQLTWSAQWHHSDTLVRQRKTSFNWLELTCAIDILSGGNVGLRDGSFLEKMQIIKVGTRELLRVMNFVVPGGTGEGELGFKMQGK